jgi:hypothetical protein
MLRPYSQRAMHWRRTYEMDIQFGFIICLLSELAHSGRERQAEVPLCYSSAQDRCLV